MRSYVKCAVCARLLPRAKNQAARQVACNARPMTSATSIFEKPLGTDEALEARITSPSFQHTVADLVKRAYVSYTIAHQKTPVLALDNDEGEQERAGFDSMVKVFEHYLRRAEILVGAYRGDALPPELEEVLMFLLQIYTVLRGRNEMGLSLIALLGQLPSPHEVFVMLSAVEISVWLEAHDSAVPPPNIVLPCL